VALAQNAATAGVPAAVVEATVLAGGFLAAGRTAAAGVISARALTLAEGVLKTMLLTKLKIATAVLAVLAAVAALATGAAALSLHAPAENPPAPPAKEKQALPAKPADQPGAKPDTKPEGRVPSGRLREQTDRADRAETALRSANEERERERADFNRRFDEMNGRFTTLVTALQGGQRPSPSAPPEVRPQGPPDIFENPQGFTEYQDRQRQSDMSRVEQMFANMRFQNSMDIARAMHKDKFEAAWESVNKLSADKPDELAAARHIYNAPNPGAELMKWHARNETLRIVGDDPVKYRETVSSEIRDALMKDPDFRKQLLDDLRAEATGETPSRPQRSITRLPKSLNGATGQSHQKGRDPLVADTDDSDTAVFNSAWR